MKLGSATSLPKSKLHGHWRTHLLRLLPPTTAQRLTQLALRRGLGLATSSAARSCIIFRYARHFAGRGRTAASHRFGGRALIPMPPAYQPCRAWVLPFLEVGTVTPRAQHAHAHAHALCVCPSKWGLLDRNACANDGMEEVATRLQALRWEVSSCATGGQYRQQSTAHTGSVGAVYDYLQGIETFRELAHFIVLNVSASQPSVGLHSPADRAFISTIAAESDKSLLPKLWLKLDPDMARQEFQALVAAVAEHGPSAGWCVD